MAVFRPRGTIRAWDRHRYGQAVLLNDHVYVPIPKSASSWCNEMWGDGKSVDFNESQLKNLPHVVILRDPIERWIAGFAQCQVGNDPAWDGHWERLGWDWVFQKVVFDNHTEPQVSFIAGIDLDRVIWFRMDDDLEFSMVAWMRESMGLDKRPGVADRNRSEDQPAPKFRDGRLGRSQAEIRAMARGALAAVPGARQRLEDVYQEDLELYRSVRYFNKEQ